MHRVNRPECVAYKQEKRAGRIATVYRLVLATEDVLSLTRFPLEISHVVARCLVADEQGLALFVGAVLRQIH